MRDHPCSRRHLPRFVPAQQIVGRTATAHTSTNFGEHNVLVDDRRICANCVGETHLRHLIIEDGLVATCNYCLGDDESCIDLESLATHVEEAFQRHYYRTSDQPDIYESMLLRDKESSYDWDRHGEPVRDIVAEAASVVDDVAGDIAEILEDRHSDLDSAQIGEECEFDADSRYEWKDARDHEFAVEWQTIERSLKSESRFFNQRAEAFLAKLFADLPERMTREGRRVVVTAGPDTDRTSFFRARVFHKDDELDEAMMRPDLHLGPPPGRFARAGRMNANGISMFYGASHESVALAEVRPPVGSRALVGEFRLLRPLRLLDVSALHSVYVEGSIFDPSYIDQLGLAKFMKRLSNRVTIPVMPDDEPTEYLITQMIADYLARQPAPGLDGILFPSVQCPGEHRNVVLFHHASRVETLEFPEGVRLTAQQCSSTEDGEEPDYRVWEEIPLSMDSEAEKKDHMAGFSGIRDLPTYHRSTDQRDAMLGVLTDSLKAHHVTGVSITTTEHTVSRHRTENRSWGNTTESIPDLSFHDF